MELKHFVLGNVAPNDYYKSRFRGWDPRSGNNVTCPFHDDVHPSLSVGLEHGAARCWAASCGRCWGNIVHFEADLAKVSESESATRLYSEFVRPTVPEDELATLQNNLRSSARHIKLLSTDCGINADGIRIFGLGLDRRTGRIAIPIRDRWGNCVNVRLYKLPSERRPEDDRAKMINLTRGKKGTPEYITYGRLDLFSWPQFLRFDISKPVFIMASEKEAMVATLHGLQAICGTCGEDAWDDEWNEYFVGYDIGIVGQNDAGGQRAAENKIATLQKVANVCVNIRVPASQKDFADWVVKERGNGIALLAQMKEKAGKVASEYPAAVPPTHATNGHKSESLVPVGTQTEPALPTFFTEELQEVASISNKTEMFNHRIKCHGIIAGKAGNTYTIPWKFKVSAKNRPQRLFVLPVGRELLSFIRASDAAIAATICELVGDKKAVVEAVEYITAIEVELIPTATIERDVPYIVQRCTYLGRWIDANVPYELEIIPISDIRTQSTQGIITKVTPISLSFEQNTMTDEEFATLQIFRPSESQSIWAKMMSMADELAQHYTKIYNRPDWHIVSLLTWASPIGWRFPNETDIQRGWLNTLAIGDTETGKSKVTKTLQQITRCGQIVNAENCTYVGLVGGAVKMGSGQFMLRWGRIPLCDKQLVVIEELSGLTIEQISHMSDVRSSGVARLDKGGLSAETNARTRILILSNVRNPNKTLASYTSGVRAVQELIGHGEDIARFDLIITLVDSDVSVEVINQPETTGNRARDFQSSDLQQLIRFAWALKPDQIRFSTEAYFACLEHTKDLSAEYHPGIPLFKGGSGRYKIARIAASIATLQFAWNGTHIVVNEEHVDAAVQLLRHLYNKPPMRYDEWSKQSYDRDSVRDIEELNNTLTRTLPNARKREKSVEALIHASKFSRDELCAIASIPIMLADDVIGVMLRNRVLRKGDANTWEITPAGKSWLESHAK